MHCGRIDLVSFHTEAHQLVALGAVDEFTCEADCLERFFWTVGTDSIAKGTISMLGSDAIFVLDDQNGAVGVQGDVLHSWAEDCRVTINELVFNW